MAQLPAIVHWVSLKELQAKSYVAYLGVWFRGLQEQGTGTKIHGRRKCDPGWLVHFVSAMADKLFNTVGKPENPSTGPTSQDHPFKEKKGKIFTLWLLSPSGQELSQFTLQFLSLCFSLCQRSSRIGSRDWYPTPETRPCLFASVGNWSKPLVGITSDIFVSLWCM